MLWPIPGVFFYIFTVTLSVTDMKYVYVGLPLAAFFYILFFFTITKDITKKDLQGKPVKNEEGHTEYTQEQGC